MNIFRTIVTAVVIWGWITSSVFSFANSEVVLDSKMLDMPTASTYTIISDLNIESYGQNSITGDIGIYDPFVKEIAITGTHKGLKVPKSDGVYNAEQDAIKVINRVEAARITSYSTGAIGDETYVPGVYKATSDMTINNTMTLDGKGDNTSIFVFDIEGGLSTKSFSRVWLTNGAKSENVYWIVKSSARLESDSEFNGNLICLGDIEAKSGLKMQGRLISLNSAVKFNNIQLSVPPYEKQNVVVPIDKKVVKLFINSNKIIVNGIESTSDTVPFIKNGRTYVPVSLVTKQLGGEANYTKDTLGNTNAVFINVSGISATLKIGEKSIDVINRGISSTVYADAAPLIIEGRTMIPFKALSDVLSANVNYGMKKDNSGVDWVVFEK